MARPKKDEQLPHGVFDLLAELVCDYVEAERQVAPPEARLEDHAISHGSLMR